VIGESETRLPRWLWPMNQIIKTLQRMGIAFFSFHLISVPGRRSGLLRTTPVSPFSVDGQRYILSFGQTEWVKNARESGWGILARGRRQSKVALVEVRPPESAVIVREFPLKIPAGVQFFVRLGLVEKPAGPDQFHAAAERLALFRIDPTQDGQVGAVQHSG
jgi:Domain of unknown function (DUF385).